MRIVDALRLSDRTPSELRGLTGLPSNLLAFHLDVLEDAGLVTRRPSEGDARRRYVTLRWDASADVDPVPEIPVGDLLFVCTRNSARSQLAAALWRARTGRRTSSAGWQPAAAIDPMARRVARAHGLSLDAARPRRYEEVEDRPDLVVSVCDRAREAGLPWDVTHLHWSVPDPVGGDRAVFEAAYAAIEGRVDVLARATGGAR